MSALSDIRLADCDSHVTEPPDLWTSRISAKYLDDVPRVDPHPVSGVNRWHVDEIWMYPLAASAYVGWHEYPPRNPTRWEDIDTASYDPVARLARLDGLGIQAQTLYPNLLGFATGVFMGMQPEVGLACVQAYNDFLADFASADPKRLIPIAMVPFWDVDAAVTELERATELGHRGVLFANKFEKLRLPSFTNPHWDPIYDAAQSLGISMNFHAGFANSPVPGEKQADVDLFGAFDGDIGDLAATVATTMLKSNAQAFGTIVTCGIAERFPRLKFVSVESGVGYIPFLLDSLDWHFKGYGVGEATGRRLPSEIFREQCLGTFWFETAALSLFEQYADNFMFSTDFPHPTSLVPSPKSPALNPREHVERYYGDVPIDVARKVLWENAAKLYRLED